MVPIPCESLIVAFDGEVKFTAKVSVLSTAASSQTRTSIVLEVSPAAKVNAVEETGR